VFITFAFVISFWVVKNQRIFSDHPVCAAKEQGHFIDGAATPPLEEGSAEACPQYIIVKD